jgi:hypothetical protein
MSGAVVCAQTLSPDYGEHRHKMCLWAHFQEVSLHLWDKCCCFYSLTFHSLETSFMLTDSSWKCCTVAESRKELLVEKPRKIPIRLTGQQAALPPESRRRSLCKLCLSASPFVQGLDVLAHKSVLPASQQQSCNRALRFPSALQKVLLSPYPSKGASLGSLRANISPERY